MEENTYQPLDEGLSSPDPSSSSGFRITPEVRTYWKEAANWGLFFSVLGFLYLGMMALLILSAVSSLAYLPGASVISMLFVFMIAVPIVWLMFNFSRHTRRAVLYNNTAAANVGFSNLRRLFQFYGILVLVVLVIYGLIFLIGLFSIL